jgi:hypothetical protein
LIYRTAKDEVNGLRLLLRGGAFGEKIFLLQYSGAKPRLSAAATTNTEDGGRILTSVPCPQTSVFAHNMLEFAHNYTVNYVQNRAYYVHSYAGG